MAGAWSTRSRQSSGWKRCGPARRAVDEARRRRVVVVGDRRLRRLRCAGERGGVPQRGVAVEPRRDLIRRQLQRVRGRHARRGEQVELAVGHGRSRRSITGSEPCYGRKPAGAISRTRRNFTTPPAFVGGPLTYHGSDMTDTILIVDDEESVRRTFQEWLASVGLGGAGVRRRRRRVGPAGRQRAPDRPGRPRLEPRLRQRRAAAARRPRRVPPGRRRHPRHRLRPPGHAARRPAHGRPRLPRQEPGPQPRDVPARPSAGSSTASARPSGSAS